jgi:peptidoglycan/xylan/chitin deacetylase (PgdA/CDA1 family)
MYHRVIRDGDPVDGIEPGMYVRASTFDLHLTWLRERWRIRTLGEAIDSPPAPGEPPVVVLTFDDGWRDNLTAAWPILERHGARATIFLVREYCESGIHAAGSFMVPAEIGELARRGMEFGAHTATHPDLTKLGDEAAESEMRRSKEAVEQWTGRPCGGFAYPYGRHRDATAAIARRLFRASVIVGGGWWIPGGDLARIPRVGIHEDMTFTRAMFERRLAA